MSAEIAVQLVLWVAGVLTLLGLGAFLVVTAYLYYVHQMYAHIPSPKPFNFYLGHLPLLNRDEKANIPPGITYLEWSKECGPIYVFFIFHMPLIITIDPKDVKELFMSTKVNKPGTIYGKLSYIFGERFQGNGLPAALTYDDCKERRRMYDPAFTKAYLKSLIPSFNECVGNLIEKLEPYADGKSPVAMDSEFSMFTLDVISKVAFGENYRDWSVPSFEDQPIGEFLPRMQKHTVKAILLQLHSPWFRYLHPWKAQTYRDAAIIIRRLGRECIQRRIQALEKKEQVPNDILTHILRGASEGVTIEDLVDDFVAFYDGGQETSASLLSFALASILMHEPVLERLQDEVAEVLGDKEYVTAEDVDKLEYTEQILWETLRLYPPAPTVARETGNEMMLGDYKIPKHTMFLVSMFTSSRIPEHFPDPERFDPGRFDPEQQKLDPFVFYPFTRGHRACIGKTFAMIEAKIVVARLVQKFQFILPEGYKLEYTSTGTMHINALTCNLKLK